MYVWIYVCMYVYVNMWVDICMYIYMEALTNIHALQTCLPRYCTIMKMACHMCFILPIGIYYYSKLTRDDNMPCTTFYHHVYLHAHMHTHTR